MLKSFSPTIKGKIISVDYFLKVFIKYDSWNEWSDHSCTLSIDILQPPMQLVQPLPAAMVPTNWNPAVQSMVHFGLPVDQMQQPTGQPTQVMMMQQSVDQNQQQMAVGQMVMPPAPQMMQQDG